MRLCSSGWTSKQIWFGMSCTPFSANYLTNGDKIMMVSFKCEAPTTASCCIYWTLPNMMFGHVNYWWPNHGPWRPGQRKFKQYCRCICVLPLPLRFLLILFYDMVYGGRGHPLSQHSFTNTLLDCRSEHATDCIKQLRAGGLVSSSS